MRLPHLCVLLLPSRSWMMCAWQNAKLSEQMLTCVPLGMDVKMLSKTCGANSPCNAYRVVGMLVVASPGELCLPTVKD